MVAIDKLFCTRWKKTVLWIVGQNFPEAGEIEVGTGTTETVTMAEGVRRERGGHSEL
jgi:hypothetical protein